MVEINVRPSVAKFAVAMEERLRANDHKTGKLNNELGALHIRLQEEAEELRDAIEYGAPAQQVLHESADVANFAMMIAESAGALS